MWPLLLDMTKEESLHSLRCLELEAYAGLVSALRAQGSLSSEKVKLLKETSALLNISQDRHKAEIRRAVNDEKLNTIAYHVSGQKLTSEEWSQEGRRLVPLMPRVAPQTAYSAIADEIADAANKNNKLLPNPSSTERKRPVSLPSQTPISDINKTMSFRIPEPPKQEDSKKRKLSIPMEGSSLAQHLMGPPKLSKIQQIYRQKTKARQKELQLKMKENQEKSIESNVLPQKLLHQSSQKVPVTNLDGSGKVNIIQNISLPTSENEDVEIKNEPSDSDKVSDGDNLFVQPGTSNENQSLKTKQVISCPKLNQHITLKHVTTASPNGEKQIKVCGTRKNLTTKCITTGQKLIVVSNPQSITTSSILQRTLTIPFVKNISVKNIDKFKIVTTNANHNIQLTTFTTSGQLTPGKHKVVTVRTNPSVKKVIPLSQLQVLNAKGSIKVLPLGGKIVTKTNTGSTPMYIVNSGNMQCITKSTTSSPVMMTSKVQDSEDSKYLPASKNSDENMNTSESSNQLESSPANVKEESNSNLLSDLMDTDNVVPSENTNFESSESKNECFSYITENTGEFKGETIDKESVDMKSEGSNDEERNKSTDSENKEIVLENYARDEQTVIETNDKPTNDSSTYMGDQGKSSEELYEKLDDNITSHGNSGILDPITGLYTLTTDNITYQQSNEVNLAEEVNIDSLEENLRD